MDIDQALTQIRKLVAAGDWQAACEISERALALFPGQAQIWFFLGISRHALGARSAAASALSEATNLAPEVPAFFNALATVLMEEGRLAPALEAMTRAVTLAPSDPATLVNYGVVLERTGRIESALAAYEHALKTDRTFAPALMNRGAALMRLQRFGEAVDNNEFLVALRPDSADAHFNLSQSLLGFGLSEPALKASERAIALDPRHARAHVDRGLALADLGRFEEARFVFDTVEEIEPGAIRAYLERIAPADPALGRSIDPRLFFLYRGYDRLMRCDWSMRDLYIRELGDLVRSNDQSDMACLDLPLVYQSLTVPVPPDIPYRIASVIGARYADAVTSTGVKFGYKRGGHRIRIGYLSADYCEHLNAYLAYPLFRTHDRGQFEIFAYSIGPDDGADIRGKIKSSADRFVDLRNVSDLDAARIINRDGIDLLVDFGGYTEHCRPGIAAFRSAPVQLAYLGFPGTMAAPWIDYRFTDRIATPQGDERFWRESLVYLPDTFFIYDRFESLPDVNLTRAEYGLPEDAFVFCSFNNYYKIEPGIFGLWMEILRAVPGSVLWLAGRGRATVNNLRREAGIRGVPEERLVFAPFESRERYRARFGLADVYLDTPIFSAMTTTCDALWAGLPLITCPGATFTSRVSASLLTAIGLEDCILPDVATYRSRAVALATDPGRLAELRDRLARNRLTTALFDTEARVRQLEAAFDEMWRRHLAGLPPASFEVKPPVSMDFGTRWY